MCVLTNSVCVWYPPSSRERRETFGDCIMQIISFYLSKITLKEHNHHLILFKKYFISGKIV